MKRGILILLLVGLGAASPFLVRYLSEKMSPEAFVKVPEFDAGVASNEAVEVEHTFLVQNLGWRSLSINKIATSCQCTTAVLPGIIEPGRCAEIPVKVKILRGGGGLKVASIVLFTNSKFKPFVDLKFKVVEPFSQSVSPGLLDFGGGQLGEDKSICARLEYSEAEVPDGLQVKSLSFSGHAAEIIKIADVKLTREPRDVPGGKAVNVLTFNCVLHSKDEQDLSFDALSVKTNSLHFGEVRIPVRWKVRGQVGSTEEREQINGSQG